MTEGETVIVIQEFNQEDNQSGNLNFDVGFYRVGRSDMERAVKRKYLAYLYTGFPIQEGDWVWIESPRNKIKQRVRITEAIYPRAVNVEHASWFPEDLPPD